MALLVILISGAALWGGSASWRRNWSEIERSNNETIEFRLGLLEMRLQEHRQKAELLAQDGELQDLAAEENISQIRSKLNRAIRIDDQERVLVVNQWGNIVAQQPSQIPSFALTDCLRVRIQRMRLLHLHQTASLTCLAGQQVMVGAISPMRHDHSQQSSAGYLVHLSPLQGRGLTPALSTWFRKLGNDLEVHSGQAHANGLHMNDLLPVNQHLDLKQEHQTTFTVTTDTLKSVLLPWLLAAGLAVYGAASLLLNSRKQRLLQAHDALKSQRAQRSERKELKQMLITPRQLQSSLDVDQESSVQRALILLDFEGKEPNILTKTHEDCIAYRLAKQLHDGLNPHAIARLNNNQLCLILDQALTTTWAEDLQSAIHAVDSTVIQHMNTVQPLIMRALISPANQKRGSLQIRDLCFKLSSLPRETTVQIWQLANQKGDTSEQNAGRETEQLDHRTLESFNKQNHEQHQALLIQSGNKSRLYTRLSFNLLSQLIDANPSTSMLPLGMLRQIKDSPSFDRHMLRQALARINENNQTAKPTLIRISSTSLRDSEHFQKLLQELDGRPSEDLAQLILELEAVSLLSGTGYCRQEVKHLQEMGVAIAIDDRAINAPPIKAIFSLGPRYLMVGPGFSDRSRDSNAETVVEFLLGYCRYKHCTLVMTEVNDADTLKYWNSRGVAAFEGEQAQRLAA